MLTTFNLSNYLAKTITTYFHSWTFEISVYLTTSTRRNMFAGVAKGRLASLTPFNLYVNDVPTPSRHIALSFHDKAVIATSRQSTLLLSCLETSQPSLALVSALQDSHHHLEDHGSTLC
jgi:hypothetical protein